MRVIIAKSAGFCMGVRRAMSKAFLTLKKESGQIYTYGPLIHNPQVVKLLSEKGVSSVADVSGTDRGTIVIRAHGISPQERQQIRTTHLKIVDATCPKVMKIHAAAKKHHKQGYLVVVVGDRDHPEVSGILGYTEGKGVVVASPRRSPACPTPNASWWWRRPRSARRYFRASLSRSRGGIRGRGRGGGHPL